MRRWLLWQLGLPAAWTTHRLAMGAKPHPEALERYSVRIVRLTEPVDNDKWLRLAFEALILLETYHPAKFDRVREFVKNVVFFWDTFTSSRDVVYHWSYRLCAINARSFEVSRSTVQLKIHIAGDILGQATLGYLLGLGGMCSKQPPVRLTTICQLERDRVVLALADRLNTFV